LIERFGCFYSSTIAPTGHPPAQEPQLIHVAASISNLPSPSAIAPTGHCPAQAPQEIQASEITYAIILILLIDKKSLLIIKYQSPVLILI
jgi:hypothetical protein